MSSTKLSTSFSSNDLLHFSSYREQRLYSKPSEMGELANSRTDLENIQQCLRNSMYRKRESSGKHTKEHLEMMIGKISREIQNFSTPKIMEDRRDGEDGLNVIQENPKYEGENVRKQGHRGQGKTRANFHSNKNLLSTATPKPYTSNPKPTPTTILQPKNPNLLTSKQSLKKPTTRPTTNYKQPPRVSKTDVQKISKKIQFFQSELQCIPFRRQQEILEKMQQILELVKEE